MPSSHVSPNRPARLRARRNRVGGCARTSRRGEAGGAFGLSMSGAAFPAWERGLVAALDRLSIGAFRAPRGQLAGPVLSRDVGRALEFADYRAYTPGDDPKLVDWRAYARLDRLYLKQYREERARTVSVLVDVSSSLDFGDG